MDGESFPVDFAAIGHQTSWTRIAALVGALREAGPALELQELRETVPWIPPRVLMRARFASTSTGRSVDGAYVETFIDPDELGSAHFKRNLAKVRAAIQCAQREGAPLATLGGFSSIVLESASGDFALPSAPLLTTGNSLTSAFVVRGVQRAAQLLGIDLARTPLGVVGASGDIGSACVRALAGQVSEVLLCARNPQRLRALQSECNAVGLRARISADANELCRNAQVIICAASMAEPELDLNACGPDTLVCDVGYPKNVLAAGSARVFWGGLGQVRGGWSVLSGVPATFYELGSNVLHGCLLEAVVLALEGWLVPYSRGRGAITAERVAEIGAAAERHGIVTAPLMNHAGLWPEELLLENKASKVGASVFRTSHSGH